MTQAPQVVIRDWVILECEAGGLKTQHVAGWIVRHHRLGIGEPYIGSPLTEFNLAARSARNQAGRLVELVGDPLSTEEELPEAIARMVERAGCAWGLNENAAWRRLA